MLCPAWNIIQIKEEKKMLTDKQKKDFENLFNFYSLQKSYDSESRAELTAKMAGFEKCSNQS